MAVSYTVKVNFDLTDPLKVQMVQSAIEEAFQKINFSPFETGKMPASAISVDVAKTSKPKG
jgi:AMMECR1 domain-containing protein